MGHRPHVADQGSHGANLLSQERDPRARLLARLGGLSGRAAREMLARLDRAERDGLEVPFSLQPMRDGRLLVRFGEPRRPPEVFVLDSGDEAGA